MEDMSAQFILKMAERALYQMFVMLLLKALCHLKEEWLYLKCKVCYAAIYFIFIFGAPLKLQNFFSVHK